MFTNENEFKKTGVVHCSRGLSPRGNSFSVFLLTLEIYSLFYHLIIFEDALKRTLKLRLESRLSCFYLVQYIYLQAFTDSLLSQWAMGQGQLKNSDIWLHLVIQRIHFTSKQKQKRLTQGTFVEHQMTLGSQSEVCSVPFACLMNVCDSEHGSKELPPKL